MSVSAVDPEVEAIVRALKDAVQDLPIERQDAAFEQMGMALVEADRTGSSSPISRYVQSLKLTSRLHRNPAYRKALAEADAELEREMVEALPVASFVDAMRANYP